jgi:hypothetical protein
MLRSLKASSHLEVISTNDDGVAKLSDRVLNRKTSTYFENKEELLL